jgi:hypothetical protein
MFDSVNKDLAYYFPGCANVQDELSPVILFVRRAATPARAQVGQPSDRHQSFVLPSLLADNFPATTSHLQSSRP